MNELLVFLFLLDKLVGRCVPESSLNSSLVGSFIEQSVFLLFCRFGAGVFLLLMGSDFPGVEIFNPFGFNCPDHPCPEIFVTFVLQWLAFDDSLDPMVYLVGVS